MEKLGVVTDDSLTKQGSKDGDTCPKCGSTLIQSNPRICPKCGSEPLEPKEEEDAS